MEPLRYRNYTTLNVEGTGLCFFICTRWYGVLTTLSTLTRAFSSIPRIPGVLINVRETSILNSSKVPKDWEGQLGYFLIRSYLGTYRACETDSSLITGIPRPAAFVLDEETGSMDSPSESCQ